jgi:multiple antibiotic resistance protein
MICGSGAMTNVFVMMKDADAIEKKIALILGVFVVIVCTYLILYSALIIIKILGQTVLIS